jgi:uncharacterized membrane protein HdeD (DUF308 family)
MILVGILAVIVGIFAVAWPGVTILALVILFAVYAFMDAVLQATRSFTSRAAGPVAGHLLLALIDLAAGVVALIAPTAFVSVPWWRPRSPRMNRRPGAASRPPTA